MTEPEHTQIRQDYRWGAVIVWLSFLLLPSLLFLASYIVIFGAPYVSYLAHMKIVGSLLLAIIGVRMLAGSASGSDCRAAQFVRAAIVSTFAFVLVIYYLTAVIGLHSWGRIFTIELISSYIGSALLSVLSSFGVPGSVFIPLLVLSFFILLRLYLEFEKRIGIAAPFPDTISRSARFLIGGMFVLISGFTLLSFTGNPEGRKQEPFALTFFPEYFGKSLQSLSMDRVLAQRYDQDADAARRSYRIPPDPQPLPSILLFVVDGLRPDHMSILGYERNTTPIIDKAVSSSPVGAAGSIHSVCAESTCGLLSLASSRYPHEFSANFFSLYEVLSLAGYRTSLLLSGDHAGFYGLTELYGQVDFLVDAGAFPEIEVNDDSVLLTMIDSLPQHANGPLFFQFHLMSAHNLGKRWEEMDFYQPSRNYGFPLFRGTREESINFYDNGVRQMDFLIGQIVEHLEESGMIDRHIVVITSDHGEALGEHGIWSHSRSVIDEVLRIPFVLFSNDPTVGERINERSLSSGSIVDVAPTIATALGLPIPDTWSGVSVFSRASDRTIHFRQGGLAGLIKLSSGGSTMKYWRNAETGEEFVYDLLSDPGEQTNLAGQVSPDDINQWRSSVFRSQAAIDAR